VHRYNIYHQSDQTKIGKYLKESQFTTIQLEGKIFTLLPFQ